MRLKELVELCISKPHEPLGDEQRALLERKLGRELPVDLKRLYSLAGRGTFRRRYFANDKYEFEISELIPAELDCLRNVASVHEDVVQRRALIPRGLLPFAAGSGGDFFCVDLADSSIVFTPMDPPGTEPRFVASDLEVFMAGLSDDPEF